VTTRAERRRAERAARKTPQTTAPDYCARCRACGGDSAYLVHHGDRGVSNVGDCRFGKMHCDDCCSHDWATDWVE